MRLSDIGSPPRCQRGRVRFDPDLPQFTQFCPKCLAMVDAGVQIPLDALVLDGGSPSRRQTVFCLVAQRWSRRLLSGRLQVRVLPGQLWEEGLAESRRRQLPAKQSTGSTRARHTFPLSLLGYYQSEPGRSSPLGVIRACQVARETPGKTLRQQPSPMSKLIDAWPVDAPVSFVPVQF